MMNDVACFSYPWSPYLYFLNTRVTKNLILPMPPITQSFHPHWDGIFVASQMGDVIHAF